MERLTVTETKFLAPIAASKEQLIAEIKRHQKYYDRLAEYEDAEDKGLLIKLPSETDKGDITYIYGGSVWVVRLEHIGNVISKRKVTKFYPNYETAEEALKGSVSQ